MNRSTTTSSIISVNTINDSDIPKDAVVTGLSTTATLSPSQGITTHTLINNGTQYQSNSAFQGSGSFSYIDVEQGIPAKAEWGFRYVTGATGASTMSRVTMLMYYQYSKKSAETRSKISFCYSEQLREVAKYYSVTDDLVLNIDYKNESLYDVDQRKQYEAGETDWIDDMAKDFMVNSR